MALAINDRFSMGSRINGFSLVTLRAASTTMLMAATRIERECVYVFIYVSEWVRGG